MAYKGIWSLINLLLMLAGAALPVWLILYKRRNRRQNRKSFAGASAAIALLMILLFFITSDFSNALVLFNQFTWIFALLAVLQGLILLLYYRKNRSHAAQG